MNAGHRLTEIARELAITYPHLTPSRAYALARDRHPDLARADHLGADADVAPLPVEQDPARVLLNNVAARIAAGMSPAAAHQAAREALPAVYAAWDRGVSLEPPAPAPGGASDPLHPPMRHFSTLAPAERERALPRLRRLAPGERPPVGATTVEKFAPVANGGGSFVVMEG